MPRLRTALELLVIAYNRFVFHDAWAIASHIALSILMSLFPFLILVTALASFFGTGSLADEAADIILEAWPSEVAGPIANEVHRVLTDRREGILTLGILLALYFASSGVEALAEVVHRASKEELRIALPYRPGEAPALQGAVEDEGGAHRRHMA